MNPKMSQRGEIGWWFADYREFRQGLGAAGFASFEREFQRLTVELQPLRVTAAQRVAASAPDFNVFRILRLQRKELITHSPFLANLLNPAGTHAQGDLFLRLFLERLALKQARLPASIVGGRWFVRQEQVTDSGNLDIHLWSHPLRCEIVIENKIGAADQDDQLSRYWDHMQAQQAQFDFQHLVYLTPQSRVPVAKGKPLPPYINLTYREDICALLRDALPIIHSPRLQYSLEQYLEITTTS
ncbi:MAG: PD-(D/E)XK nuclease family protein [Chthoniobacter sp.]|uniref:PDDEXK-like family protein n=1 Tax=Chthoniobacter sp. TaxID=2510640 RepID=UPI0032AA1147